MTEGIVTEGIELTDFKLIDITKNGHEWVVTEISDNQPFDISLECKNCGVLLYLDEKEFKTMKIKAEYGSLVDSKCENEMLKNII